MRYDDTNWRLLAGEPATENGLPEVLPRRTIYGSAEATACGLIPLMDFPDLLIDPSDYKEVIADCHEKKIFPIYHQLASGNFDQRWNQDGLGFCWSWSLTASVMDARALENQPPVLLAPVTLGWLVNWRNAGWYLDSAIKGARERGIAPASYVPNQHSLSHRQYKAGWEEAALDYRPLEWFDTRRYSTASMIQQCISVLALGRPGYCAWNHMAHAMEVIGVEWDESQRNNLVWQIRNSHNESAPIEMVGDRAVPDEFYGVRAISLPNQ